MEQCLGNTPPLAGDVQCESVCVTLDCLKHATTTVHAFVSTVLSHIKVEHPFLKKLLFFGGGAPSQYKNYKNFTTLCQYQKDHGFNVEWHFFAASHGKSLSDDIGGTEKRLIARASLLAAADGHILTSSKMYD